MGRLIDADKLLETLQDLEPHCENKDYEYGMLNTMRYYMPKIINDEPTVFDVDKVAEQLEEVKNKDTEIALDEAQKKMLLVCARHEQSYRDCERRWKLRRKYGSICNR